MFAVFDDNKVWDSYGYDSKLLLYRVREALTGFRVETVGSRGHAVRLFYSSGPHIDITPAFRAFSIFGRPDGYRIHAATGTDSGRTPTSTTTSWCGTTRRSAAT